MRPVCLRERQLDEQSQRVHRFAMVATQRDCARCADGSLVPIAGSPFCLSGSANAPGPILVDPYGNYVYALGTLSNTISPLKISPVSGALDGVESGDDGDRRGAGVDRDSRGRQLDVCDELRSMGRAAARYRSIPLRQRPALLSVLP